MPTWNVHTGMLIAKSSLKRGAPLGSPRSPEESQRIVARVPAPERQRGLSLQEVDETIQSIPTCTWTAQALLVAPKAILTANCGEKGGEGCPSECGSWSVSAVAAFPPSWKGKHRTTASCLVMPKAPDQGICPEPHTSCHAVGARALPPARSQQANPPGATGWGVVPPCSASRVRLALSADPRTSRIV